ncbi:Phospho-2-dehydro-3-deoxyheptonate aldolase, Tyr-sensitive [Gimesia aquarii]|uniref:Phospho-2-dehydro-3-deoxyheptonate aldolase n=2 Tax=Gimesia aquarii TaxID=2527964 RepID=A0A517X3Q0_9PLAN|nr:Phospho-2-dehydro-3-deoxyheptonate aldolase, Tyr-sensitive [Gimesia aquarii]
MKTIEEPMLPIQNVNVHDSIRLVAPKELKETYKRTDKVTQTVGESRENIKRILSGEDQRLIVVVGPCSIHDPQAAVEYAKRLKELSSKVDDHMFLIMRVYFEKPRTTVGWKGLINDPHLDGTFDVSSGLKIARQLLLQIGEIGLPTATEMLEPITPQYIADVISIASIGARTTESPTHRQMASGLSMPVGYKNGTDGSLDVALNAMLAAQSPHSFLGIDADGQTCVINTKGNPWGHLILRGGRSGPNYQREHLKAAADRLRSAGLSPHFLVDCSHANSNKDYRNQGIVWNDVIDQRVAGNETIIGLMLESNLHAGNQKLTDDLSQLQYGVSITDECIDWEETESLILTAHEKLA